MVQLTMLLLSALNYVDNKVPVDLGRKVWTPETLILPLPQEEGVDLMNRETAHER